MNVPLGLAIGNANEVRESVEVLAGGGPPMSSSSRSRSLARCSHWPDVRDADVEGALNGRAGDGQLARHDQRAGRRPGCAAADRRARRTVVRAERSGMLVEQHALPFGIAAWRLGAGRARQQDPVQHAAGIDLHAKPGDTVAGPAALHPGHRRSRPLRPALEALEGAYRIGEPGEPIHDGGPLIAGRIG